MSEVDSVIDGLTCGLTSAVERLRAMAQREAEFSAQHAGCADVAEAYKKLLVDYDEVAKISHKYRNDAERLGIELDHWRKRALFAEQFVPHARAKW